MYTVSCTFQQIFYSLWVYDIQSPSVWNFSNSTSNNWTGFRNNVRKRGSNCFTQHCILSKSRMRISTQRTQITKFLTQFLIVGNSTSFHSVLGFQFLRFSGHGCRILLTWNIKSKFARHNWGWKCTRTKGKILEFLTSKLQDDLRKFMWSG